VTLVLNGLKWQYNSARKPCTLSVVCLCLCQGQLPDCCCNKSRVLLQNLQVDVKWV